MSKFFKEVDRINNEEHVELLKIRDGLYLKELIIIKGVTKYSISRNLFCPKDEQHVYCITKYDNYETFNMRFVETLRLSNDGNFIVSNSIKIILPDNILEYLLKSIKLVGDKDIKTSYETSGLSVTIKVCKSGFVR